MAIPGASISLRSASEPVVVTVYPVVSTGASPGPLSGTPATAPAIKLSEAAAPVESQGTAIKQFLPVIIAVGIITAIYFMRN